MPRTATSTNDLVDQILLRMHTAIVDGLEVVGEDWVSKGRTITIPCVPQWLLRALIHPYDRRRFDRAIRSACLRRLIDESRQKFMFLPNELRIRVSPTRAIWYCVTDTELRNQVRTAAGKPAKNGVLRNATEWPGCWWDPTKGYRAYALTEKGAEKASIILDRADAADARKQNGASVTEPNYRVKPNTLAYLCLEVLFKYRAFSLDSSMSQSEIAPKLSVSLKTGKRHTANNLKTPMSGLREQGLVVSISGGGGGSYLSPTGRQFAKRLFDDSH